MEKEVRIDLDPAQGLDMSCADRAAVAALEEAIFPDPWSEASILSHIESEGGGILLARRGEDVVGYVLYKLLPPEVEIYRIATAPAARRAGVGHALLSAALDSAREAGAAQAFLDVRAGNEPAISLYRRAGFETVARRAHYYRNPCEDALVMQLSL